MPSCLSPSSSYLALALLLPVFAGCTTPHGNADQLAAAVESGERPVSMQGIGTFFDGKVTAIVTISRGIGRGIGGGKAGSRQKREEDDLKDMDEDSTMAYLQAKGALGSPMAPITMHLKLTNHSKETVSVDIHDFESDLGNFAVHPETIALAPDQVSEPDPMISQLGVTSDHIPVKVTLQLGADKETQTIVVASLLPPGKANGD